MVFRNKIDLGKKVSVMNKVGTDLNVEKCNMCLKVDTRIM